MCLKHRKSEGFSSASIVVGLVTLPAITVSRTCSIVVVVCSSDVADVAVSGVLLNVMFLPVVGTMSA